MLQPIDLTKEVNPKATLGCPVFDDFLRGGLPCGMVTELTGEAAAGKTQLALQILLTVQLPASEGGLHAKSIYIYTDGKPPVERLQKILRERFNGRPDVSLANVLIEARPINTPDDLLSSIRQLEALLEREEAAAAASGAPGSVNTEVRKVRLVVIDSVAHVFRDVGADAGEEPQVKQLARRATQLFGLANLLKRLAQRYSLAVLLTNQVMDDINEKTGAVEMGLPSAVQDARQPLQCGGHGAPLVTSGRRVQPTLGLAWANCVNCRMFLARHDFNGDVTRTLQVVFAPHLPLSYCSYWVLSDGAWALPDIMYGDPLE